MHSKRHWGRCFHMARINIEEHFWLEILQVIKKIGDEDKAIGNVMRLFRFAQERYKQEKIISDEDWKIHEFLDELVPIFAIKIEGGYALRGAEKHFNWLRERRENGKLGGKKSVEVRRNEINKLREANSSKLNPLPLPLSLGSKEPKYIAHEKIVDNSKIDAPAPAPLPLFDFEKVFEKYPRKLGKGAGIKKCKSMIKSAKQYALLNTAVENYAKHVAANVSDEKYIKHFSTFMTNWVDWVEHTSTTTIKPRSSNENLMSDAQKILLAVRKFGPDQIEDAKTFLGDDLYTRVRAMGGLGQVRQMQLNDFTARKIVDMLKGVGTS